MKTKAEIGKAIYEHIVKCIDNQVRCEYDVKRTFLVDQEDYDYLKAYGREVCFIKDPGSTRMTIATAAGMIFVDVSFLYKKSIADKLFPELKPMTLHTALQKLDINLNAGQIKHSTDLESDWFNPNDCDTLGRYSIAALSSSGWHYRSAPVKAEKKKIKVMKALYRGDYHRQLVESTHFYRDEADAKTRLGEGFIRLLPRTEEEVDEDQVS